MTLSQVYIQKVDGCIEIEHRSLASPCYPQRMYENLCRHPPAASFLEGTDLYYRDVCVGSYRYACDPHQSFKEQEQRGSIKPTAVGFKRLTMLTNLPAPLNRSALHRHYMYSENGREIHLRGFGKNE